MGITGTYNQLRRKAERPGRPRPRQPERSYDRRPARDGGWTGTGPVRAERSQRDE